jgi:hypothetical protein
MANMCSSKYAFFTSDENKAELKRLYKNLSDIIEPPNAPKDYDAGWLGNIVIWHGINRDRISCRGYTGHLDDYDPDSNFFTLETETAWSPTTELWEAVIALYEGISFVYIAEEPGSGIYTNTDIEGTYFCDRYLINIYGDTPIPEGWFLGEDKPPHIDINEYFECFDRLRDYFSDVTGKDFSTLEEMQSYIEGLFDEESGVIAGVYEFTPD